MAPAALAAFSYSLSLKVAYSGKEPIRWRGGTAFPLYKGKHDAGLCSSYRSALVSELISKRYHSWIRGGLLPAFASTQSKLQRNVGCVAVTLLLCFPFGFVWPRLTCRNAFYSTLPEFVTGLPDASAFVRWCQGKGIDADSVDLILVALLSESAGLPSHVTGSQRSKLRDLLSSTWFVVQGSSIPVQTARGSRPGDPLADLMYAFVMAGALRDIEQGMITQGLAPTLHLAGALPDHSPSEVTCAPSISWHDDAAFLFCATHSSDLRRAAAAQLELSGKLFMPEV